MDNNINENKVTVEVKKEEPKQIREFTTYDSVFAWFSYIVSYFFCLVFPVSQAPLGGMLFIILLFLFTFVFLKVKGYKIPVTSVMAGLSATVLSTSLILSSNSFIHFFTYVYCLCAYCYYLYTASGNTIKKGFSNYLIADWAEAVCVMPVMSFRKPQIHHAMFSGKRKSGLNVIKKLAIGLGVTVIPTSIAFSLLSYDDDFTNLTRSIFNFESLDFLNHFFSLIFAVPLGICLFGFYLSCADKKTSGKISEEKSKKLAEKMSIAPAVTVVAAVVPLLSVYVLFFVSQWQYYVSGFTGVLPKGFGYAEYAREGFFQLCTVSVINLIIIVLLILFAKKNKASHILLKIITLVFSVFTLVLISTAIAKLIMYINIYGLTQKRFYAAWFMLVIALVFIAVAVSRFIPKISVVTVSAAIVVASFTGLALCNADRLIAKYNVDRYLNGTISNVDIAAMEKLGDAAVPELIRLANYLDSKNGTDILKDVRNKKIVVDPEYAEDDFWEYYEVSAVDYMYTGTDNNILLTNALIKKKVELEEKEEKEIFDFTFNKRKAEIAMKASRLIK